MLRIVAFGKLLLERGNACFEVQHFMEFEQPVEQEFGRLQAHWPERAASASTSVAAAPPLACSRVAVVRRSASRLCPRMAAWTAGSRNQRWACRRLTPAAAAASSTDFPAQ